MNREQQRSLIVRALHETNGNASEAARRLKIPKSTLVYKLKALQIKG